MLGFDALGRLALGELPGVGTTEYLQTVTAGCGAGASVLKSAAFSRSASAVVSATVLTPFNVVRSLVAATSAGASVLLAVGKLASAGANAGASIGRAMTKTVSASVAITATAVKAVSRQPMLAAVDAAGALLKNAGKVLAANVTAFGQVIVDAMNVISRRVLHDPVDYFMDGLPQYRDIGRTFERMKGAAGEEVTMKAGAKGRLSKAAAGFTSRTDKRGYD